MPSFTRDLLEAEGFEGWVPFKDLPIREVPIAGGVYVVCRTSTIEPSFRDVGTGGRFKGKDPNVPAEILRAKWVDGCQVLYIGKATSLTQRLSQYRRFG